jgi:hypothetical protein
MVLGSIGPITTAALQQYDVEPDLQPEHPKIGRLVAEVARQATLLLERKRRRVTTELMTPRRAEAPSGGYRRLLNKVRERLAYRSPFSRPR